MVIVKVMGGLGNQMFQYAFGRSIELQRGFRVKYDLSYYKNTPQGDTKREIYITKFLPTDAIATLEEIKAIVRGDNKFIYKALHRLGCYQYHTKYERKDGVEAIEDVQDDSYLVGFWQSELYFSNIVSNIQSELNFSNYVIDEDVKNILGRIKSLPRTVSIHVRAGDYLLEQNQIIFGGICTSKYYRRAFEYIKGKYPDTVFLLFTNDVEWTKKNIDLPYNEIEIVSDILTGKEDWTELYLMSKCNINIIANSSYSWWAAWLNNHDDRVVICPERWTNGSENQNIICNDWIRISGE